MDRSLNEAARDIGQAMQQLRETMREKGHPTADARLSILGPDDFVLWLHVAAGEVFPGDGACRFNYKLCIGATLGEAYTKADHAIAAMPDRAERAAS